MSKETSEPVFKPTETWRIGKNVAVVSVAFMVQYTAQNAAVNLQSSINADAGLGTASLAAIYSGVIFSSFFLPVVIINWIGTKWTIALGFGMFLPYILVQLWPSFFSLISTGLLLGLGCAPVWCAMCTYIAVISEAHSKISKIPADVLLMRFLGVFFMVFQLNQVIGNLISSLVLTSGENKEAVTAVNASMIPILCGANFVPIADAREALKTQPPEKIQMLVGIFLACIFGAILIIIFGLDSLKRYAPTRNTTDPGITAMGILGMTLMVLVEPNQLMLVIISIFLGLQQAFVAADFTAAYVSCAIGTGAVGYVMMVHGIADAIGCGITGYFAKLVGRIPVICFAVVLNSCLLITLLVWRPQAHLGYVLYIIAVLLGICNSVWLVQINAFYGILFPGRKEAAFSNFRLWEGIGFLITYAVSPYLRTSTKTYLLFSTMIIGTILYFIVERREHKKKRMCTKTKESSGCDNVAFQNIE